MPAYGQELDARVAERLVDCEPVLPDNLGNDGAGFPRQLDLRTAAILVRLEPAQEVLHRDRLAFIPEDQAIWLPVLIRLHGRRQWRWFRDRDAMLLLGADAATDVLVVLEQVLRVQWCISIKRLRADPSDPQ